MELVGKESLKVSLACRLFGHCRQAFYQSKADIEKEVERERQIVKSVRDIRDEDQGIGAYKLWLMVIDMYGRDYVMGSCMSSFVAASTKTAWLHYLCLSNQHGFTTCVYRISMAKQKVSTGSVNVAKKCLVKSGKVKVIIRHPKSIAFYPKKDSFLTCGAMLFRWWIITRRNI